jgi:hypothetical protein
LDNITASTSRSEPADKTRGDAFQTFSHAVVPITNKTKQNKTKQNKTKQNKTKQNKTMVSSRAPSQVPARGALPIPSRLFRTAQRPATARSLLLTSRQPGTAAAPSLRQ